MKLRASTSGALSLASRGSSREDKSEATRWVSAAFNSMRGSEVERLSLTALILWALCFSGTNCGSAKVQSPQTQESKTEQQPASPSVTLTPEHASDSLPVAASVLSSDAEVLEVPITKVVNPSRTPVAFFVYLSRNADGKVEPEKILIGNFSLYPADRAGVFLLDPGPAVRKFSEKKQSGISEARLVFEMKRVDETRAWTPVEVTIEQPKWRAAEK